ncbi:hypothetical protein [Streptacidiphilus sp. P02-A3a]|uniref:hypothetical protein n=1 Tax=Streptacidiphilus sp. P02-A3a TaxID=2704468 RepID=UPI0015F9CD68|nr:hypothetical protein [Streptacidiphilus sp. P02-A3a]QMU73107.1 hypothetical protein GXP74_37580 [Streptacidiphilus sp. P02-A3a]
MGGNGWADTGPYQQDLAAAFRQAQDRELAGDDHGFAGRTVVELWEDPEWHEYIFTGGTGSVLDFFEFRAGEGEQDGGGTMRLLADAEVRVWAPGGQPTHAEWQDALHSGKLFALGRACGNCTVLYRDGRPSEIGYWGITAD